MACSAPLEAWRLPGGTIAWERPNIGKALLLPCGQCTRCRLTKSTEWAARCMHEGQLHFTNCSITLTYAPEHLPREGLNHTHFQDFIRKLRKYYNPLPIRYYMGGEYGEQTGRPHYHAVLFGIDAHDKRLYQETATGFELYESPSWQAIWGRGQVKLGNLTFESAAYIARYIMAKRYGDDAAAWYEQIDWQTGEITKRTREYNRMSTHPGLGKHWLEKYWTDVYPEGKIVIRGEQSQAPRYYDRQLKKRNPTQLELIQTQRETEGKKRAHDNTPERRAVKEQVAKARLNQWKRDKQ